jgi:hypothetical protein
LRDDVIRIRDIPAEDQPHVRCVVNGVASFDCVASGS